MKKILFGLIATVMFSLNGNAQKIVSGKISNGKDLIDIPTEIASNLSYKADSSEFTTINKYSETLKGNVSITFDSKNKLVSILYPSSKPLSKAVIGPIKDCYKDCMKGSGGGSESGSWLCYWMCITGI
jgi:hypothetical protein